MAPATKADSGNLSDASPKCICWGLMCVWGMYPRRIFRPNVYISLERAWEGSRSQMCRKVRARKCLGRCAAGGCPAVRGKVRCRKCLGRCAAGGAQRWAGWAAGGAVGKVGCRKCLGDGRPAVRRRRCGGEVLEMMRIRWLPPEGRADSPSKEQPPNLRLLDGCDRLLRSRNHCRGR